MIDDKNQIIRSMRSYEAGGAADDSCMETVMVAGKPKRRRKKGGCGRTQKFGKRSVPEGVKNAVKIVATAAGLGAAYVKREAIKAFAKDKLGMKKGGSVKKALKKK